MHTTLYSSFPLRKTLLVLAIGAASQAAVAAKQPGEETLIVEANETSDFKSGGDLVVPAFLDGQIAHGGRLGMLGEQKAMDVPFNVIGYTSKLIQDQQAKTIADVVSNDAGVTTCCTSFPVYSSISSSGVAALNSFSHWRSVFSCRWL